MSQLSQLQSLLVSITQKKLIVRIDYKPQATMNHIGKSDPAMNNLMIRSENCLFWKCQISNEENRYVSNDSWREPMMWFTQIAN